MMLCWKLVHSRVTRAEDSRLTFTRDIMYSCQSKERTEHRMVRAVIYILICLHVIDESILGGSVLVSHTLRGGGLGPVTMIASTS